MESNFRVENSQSFKRHTTVVPRIMLPLYDSKSNNIGFKTTLYNSIMLSYDTTVIKTQLYETFSFKHYMIHDSI